MIKLEWEMRKTFNWILKRSSSGKLTALSNADAHVASYWLLYSGHIVSQIA